MRTLAVPELSLVALVGVTGSGKSTFAREHRDAGHPADLGDCDAGCRRDVSCLHVRPVRLRLAGVESIHVPFARPDHLVRRGAAAERRVA